MQIYKENLLKLKKKYKNIKDLLIKNLMILCQLAKIYQFLINHQ